MDPLAEFTKRLEQSGNYDMADFARQTWQQLDHHAAQGPQTYRKFQEKQLSTALGNARPEHLSDRTAMLKIETGIASAAGSLLVNTAQVHIRIYRAAPSLAESMSGSFARSKTHSSIGLPAVNPKLLWQSAQLSKDAHGVIFVDIECSAKAVDAACEGTALGKTHVQQQVLQLLQQKQDINLASKSAKLFVLAPQVPGPQQSHAARENLSQMPDATSRLPAALLSKLSLVSVQDQATPSSRSTDVDQHMVEQDSDDKPTHGTSRRPLIEELTQ